MLRSLSASLVSHSRLKCIEITSSTCVSCRERRIGRRIVVEAHIKSIPEERKHVSQLDGMDLNQLQPQYRHIKALDNAPEEVRRIFTLKFGDAEEKLESKYLEYAEKLRRHKHDRDSPEMRIALLTVEIRALQEKRTRMTYWPKHLERKLLSKFKERNNLLLKLKSLSFEKYCVTLEVLDLKVIYGPEYDFKITERAKNIADMKTRVFAEVQRQNNEKARRSEEVSKLQAEILEKLKSGELKLPAESEM